MRWCSLSVGKAGKKAQSAIVYILCTISSICVIIVGDNMYAIK